mgnify:FL=1
MVVINKKRIMVMLSIILVGIFTFDIQASINANKVIETVAVPVTSKVIVLDAGHGGEDGRSG